MDVVEIMTAITTNFIWSAIISTLLVLPFMILEWVNRRAYQEGYPFQLFGILQDQMDCFLGVPLCD